MPSFAPLPHLQTPKSAGLRGLLDFARCDMGHALRVVALCATFLFNNAEAQSVTKVYPGFAIAGEEVIFTVEGRGFPADAPASLGMKFSVAPLRCNGPNRPQPPTRERYYFACTFNATPASGALKIYVKKRSGEPIPLWQSNIEVLPAAPRVLDVVVRGSVDSGVSVVTCDADARCITTVGTLMVGNPVRLEVRGENLPASLVAEVENCTADQITSDADNRSLRAYSCVPKRSGLSSFTIMSSKSTEGGSSLLSGNLAFGQADAGPGKR